MRSRLGSKKFSWKKIPILGWVLFVVTICLSLLVLNNNPSSSFVNSPNEKTLTLPGNSVLKSDEKSSVFVPYWATNNDINDSFDRYYYFGILANKNGIDTKEIGYVHIKTFLRNVPTEREKYLVIRMIDSFENSLILRDDSAQRKIIQESVVIAKENGFDGLVLDFEITALGFDSVMKEINNFVGLFAATSKESNLPFLITMYGDTFYRLRPFDVATLGKEIDGMMIMAYDFHKAGGNPGPNFPLQGRLVYGYDIKIMVDDFSRVVPKEKLTVIFGMFGYDWTIDNTTKGVGTASSLGLADIQKKFLTNCLLKNCTVNRDNVSTETSVTYTGSDGSSHIVWFEDKASMEEKKKYLKSVGIRSFSLWAYSYF